MKKNSANNDSIWQQQQTHQIINAKTDNNMTTSEIG